MHGIGAQSKTFTTAVMTKLTRALCHAASLRGFDRLCIKSFTGTAARFLIHILLIHDSLKAAAGPPMIGESVVFSDILKSDSQGAMAVSSFWAGCKSGQCLFHAASVLKHQNNKIQPPMGFEAVVCALVYERDKFAVTIFNPSKALKM